MALLVFNLTASPVALAAGNPVRSIPASAVPPAKGPAVNVTSELRPNATVDPAHGVTGGLSAAAYILLQAQVVAGDLVFEWTSDPEYLTATLVTSGPSPAAHAASHATAGADPLGTASVVATNQSTALLVDSQDVYPELSAPGTNYVGQYAGGAAIDDAVGPFVIPGYPYRTAQVVLGVGGANPVVYTIDGTDTFDNVVQDVITAAGAGTYQGAIAFKTITRVRSDVDPVGTTDVEVGNGFCVCSPIDTAIELLAVDEAVEAAVSVDVDSGTVVPTTAPDGLANFLVKFPVSLAHTHTQNGHSHNIT